MRAKFIKCVLCIFFLGVFYNPVLCLSFPYQVNDQIRIFSQHSAGPKTPDGNAVNWRVAPKFTKDGSLELSFYKNVSDQPEASDQPVCRISFSGSGKPAAWDGGPAGRDIILLDNLLIVPGFPAPCEILPVAQLKGKTDALIYDVRREVGGRVFIEKIQVTCIAVDINDALSKGWVTEDGQPVSGGLWLIRAVNLRTDTLIVQQLWSSDGFWWIYEETPFRRSWMVR